MIQDTALPRLAGALYLAIAVFGGFSIGYVPQAITVANDAHATAARLLANLSLFKAGIFADIMVILFELAIASILYVMFRASSPVLAMLALISRAGMVIVMGINLIFWVMPLTFLPQGGLTGAEALTLQFFDAHALGIFVWQLFFGTHLLALGWILIQTKRAPGLLGWGLLIGAFGYLIQGMAELMFLDSAALDLTVIALLLCVTLSEISFAIWLLIWGPQRLHSAP